MNYKRILLYFNTLKYLKASQISWRIYFLIRKKLRSMLGIKYRLSKDSSSAELKLIDSICSNVVYKNKEFNFLNKKKKFYNEINWNFSGYGKLWSYNLNYFEYLDNTSEKEGLNLINNYIDNVDDFYIGLDAFPIALRGINWIKFLTKFSIRNKKIDDSLYAQYYILKDNFELHLLGNHLLEDAFSLLMASYYFRDRVFYLQSKKYLLKELNEQLLDDGGHFELSPMYHQLILFRLLECINLVQNNECFEKELLYFLEKKAIKMLEWLNLMTYKNGDIPLFNDSSFSIAPNSKKLFDYALRLGLKWKNKKMTFVKLIQSGYYKYQNKKYELLVDAGNIGPDYIPGHAHCDIFNFELYLDKKPIIVDTGTSTYENNECRAILRSTMSHNTVMVNKEEQSSVWGSFRVANRAKVISLKCSSNYITGIHNGYNSRFNTMHKRKISFNDNNITIEDSLDLDLNAEAYIHFHPDCKIKLYPEYIFVNEQIKIFSSSKNIQVYEYLYQPEFNKLVKSKKLVINFIKKLKMEIIIENN